MKRFLLKNAISKQTWMWKAALALVLLGAFGLRTINLTNPPLDFASTRQLFSALKARGIYYQYAPDATDSQRRLAASLGDVGIVEPPLLENIVAQTYRLTGEHLWVARVYSSLFWVAAGLALFLLIRELTSSIGAAFVGMLFYLFLPYGVVASRAFMPDPLMVALIVFALWALFRWQNTSKWKWAILFGVFSGAALFVKNLSVFIILGGFAGVILGTRGLKRAVRDPQVWVMGVLLVLPVAAYTIYGSLTGLLSGQFSLRFFPQMWKDPAFYFRWDAMINNVIGFGASILALLGVFLTDKKRERPLLFGLWIGYFLFGMTFPYHFYTHDYYQLSFIPVVAVSLAFAARWLFEQFGKLNSGALSPLILVGLVLFATVVQAWYGRARLVSSDYRNEPAFWEEVGEKLGRNTSVVGLTQDYGYRLAYWGWHASTAWFTSADIGVRYLAGQDIDLMKQFAEDTAGKRYFLVTMFGELDSQPTVKDLLYTHYPIVAETDEYVIFDLKHPKDVQP